MERPNPDSQKPERKINPRRIDQEVAAPGPGIQAGPESAAETRDVRVGIDLPSRRNKALGAAVNPVHPVSIGPSERAVRRKTISDSLQHPATILSAGVCLMSGGYFLLLSPLFGAGEAAIVVASISGAAAVVTYSLRYPRLFARNTRELTERFDLQMEQTEQDQRDSLRSTLESGFARIDAPEALIVLAQLANEYEQLRASLAQGRLTDPLSLSLIPALADETYFRGLGVLSDALELMYIVETPLREGLEGKIAEVEREIRVLQNDQSRLEWLNLKQEVLASLKERLTSVGRLKLWTEQLLHQARRCEATLHTTRIELAQVRAGGTKTSLDSVIQVLEERIKQVKEVQEEIAKLGY